MSAHVSFIFQRWSIFKLSDVEIQPYNIKSFHILIKPFFTINFFITILCAFFSINIYSTFPAPPT